MKKIFSLLTLIVVTITLVSCGIKEKSFNFEQDYIVVGLEADYHPFNWFETSPNSYNAPLDGQQNAFVAGYDVEIAKFIGNYLGLEVKFVQIEWEGLIAALRSGKIDLIIAGMSPTDVRKKSINFSDFYYISNHVVVIDENNPFASATSLEELSGAKGVGQSGTVYENIIDFLSDSYGVQVIPGQGDMGGITTVIKNGVADFTVVEKDVAEGMLEKNDNFIMILESDANNNLYNLSSADRELSIGLRKIDDKLLNLVNEALSLITNEMRESWMEDAKDRS